MQLQERAGADVRARPRGGLRDDGQGARQNPDLAGVFTTFSANSPQIYPRHRPQKAQHAQRADRQHLRDAAGQSRHGLRQRLQRLRPRLPGARAGRPALPRRAATTSAACGCASPTGALVPLGTLVEIRDVTGPDLVQRYNMYTSVPLQGNAAPGVSSGHGARRRWRQLARADPAAGHRLRMDRARLSRSSTTGNTAIFIFAPVGAVRLPGARGAVRELVAAARHHPDRADGVLSALLGVMAARHGQQHPDPDRPRRAGRPRGQERHPDRRVRARRRRHEGKDPVEAVVEACRLRLRPILMTAFAFILGVVPLVIATGPGAEMRQALGTAVFFGMLGVDGLRPVPDAGLLRVAALADGQAGQEAACDAGGQARGGGV